MLELMNTLEWLVFAALEQYTHILYHVAKLGAEVMAYLPVGASPLSILSPPTKIPLPVQGRCWLGRSDLESFGCGNLGLTDLVMMTTDIKSSQLPPSATFNNHNKFTFFVIDRNMTNLNHMQTNDLDHLSVMALNAPPGSEPAGQGRQRSLVSLLHS